MTSPLQQKLRVKGPVAVTANSLEDGGVLWWTGSKWSRCLSAAAIVTTADAARTLLVDADADPAAVGAYVAPVILEEGSSPAPGNLREMIRVSGPTTPLPGHVGHRSAAAAAGIPDTAKTSG